MWLKKKLGCIVQLMTVIDDELVSAIANLMGSLITCCRLIMTSGSFELYFIDAIMIHSDFPYIPNFRLFTNVPTNFPAPRKQESAHHDIIQQRDEPRSI